MTPSPITLVTPSELARLRDQLDRDHAAYLADLERLVNVDCGSYTKDGVDDIARWTAARLTRLGARVTPIPNDRGFGDTLIAELDGADPAGPTLLCIAHMDTVFDPGTVAERPFAIRDGIATGPGVTDMKAGLLSGLYAIAALTEVLGGPPLARLLFVANPDEEIGSPVSREHIRRAAREMPAWCSNAHGPTATSSRRARGASGTRSRSMVGRRTRGSSPRRAAARSSRPRAWSMTCTRSMVGGQA
jgi:acetylornithine deacetylase/succinyl-diaminopimelate desuccinylase-like protein